jgi:hypothetical protein
MGKNNQYQSDDRVPGKDARNPMRWSDYRMVRDTYDDRTQAPPDGIYGMYRRNSGRVAGDVTSVELNTGRTGTSRGSGADSTRVRPGRDKTTDDDTVWKRGR